MITLEERVQRAAEILDRAAIEAPTRAAPRPGRAGRTPRRVVVQIAAACIVVVGLVGTVWAMSRSPSITPLGPGPEALDAPDATPGATNPEVATTTAVYAATTIPPAATLPPLPDGEGVPVTVAVASPLSWYRLQPDLDVAWMSDPSGDLLQLCFRTPAGADCAYEAVDLGEGGSPSTGVRPPLIGVESVGGQLLVVLRGDVAESDVTVTFDNGETRTAPVEVDPEIRWGVARIETPGSSWPVGSWTIYDLASTAPSTAPTTAPGEVTPMIAPTPATAGEPPDTAPPTTGPTTPTTPTG